MESRYAGYAERIAACNRMDTDLYARYNVKRGLRNADGTGVLVGLTRVGDVHGYILDEGEKVAIPGKLYYRGIDLEDLVRGARKEGRFGFEECMYLLLFGELPSAQELADFTRLVGENRALPANFAEDTIMKAPSPDIMNKLARSVLTCYSYDAKPEDRSTENSLRQCIELIARLPTMAAYAYMAKKHYYDSHSLFIHAPRPDASTAETLLSLIRPDRQYTRLEAEILDLALVIHAEHGGGNNSTFAVHVVSSADTDTYSAIAAGIGSLKGSRHGGANLKVVGMMDDIKSHIAKWSDEGMVADYLAKILRGESGDGSGLVYGQGHAVYTVSDPRAVLLRDKAAELAGETGMLEEFELYRTIERVLPDVFRRVKGSDKAMCTNVDFYSGFVYSMLGIPAELNTAIFAVSRVASWCAHRMEEVMAAGRIMRPAYKCVQPRRGYTPIPSRG